MSVMPCCSSALLSFPQLGHLTPFRSLNGHGLESPRLLSPVSAHVSILASGSGLLPINQVLCPKSKLHPWCSYTFPVVSESPFLWKNVLCDTDCSDPCSALQYPHRWVRPGLGEPHLSRLWHSGVPGQRKMLWRPFTTQLEGQTTPLPSSRPFHSLCILIISPPKAELARL